jgi:phenylpyruvate tautomerase PptA (4-oxalocrotonate tautomerase family)
MPLLKINTNKVTETEVQSLFLKAASQKVAKTLQKPEKYVMTLFEQQTPMTFGGTEENAAFLEIKSIGLTQEQTKTLAKEIPELVEKELGIDASRIYIEFANASRSFWGWNKDTF